MGIWKGKAVQWFLLALFLIVVSPASAHDVTCVYPDCEECCNYKYYHCTSDAAENYSSCIRRGIGEFWCDATRQQQLDICQENYDSCMLACSGGGGGGRPIQDPDRPIDFGPKVVLACQPKAEPKGSPTRQQKSQTLDLRFRLEDLDAAGGFDVSLPRGFSHVGVALSFEARPADLLGARVKFGIGTSSATGGRAYRDAARLILPSFATGYFGIRGELLRIEPVATSTQAGDEFTLQLILTP